MGWQIVAWFALIGWTATMVDYHFQWKKLADVADNTFRLLETALEQRNEALTELRKLTRIEALGET